MHTSEVPWESIKSSSRLFGNEGVSELSVLGHAYSRGYDALWLRSMVMVRVDIDCAVQIANRRLQALSSVNRESRMRISMAIREKKS